MADQWLIQDGDKSKPISEQKLRRRLREGDLSGLELVRPEGASAWAPLHTLPIFSEEVPHAGDPRQAAAWREISGFATHLVVFLAVMAFLGFPAWGVFWGIGVAGHAIPAVRAILALSTARSATSSALPAPTALPALPEGAREAAAADPFLARLDGVLGALQQAGESVGTLREDALALHRRRLAIFTALQESHPAALEAELAARQQVAAAATRATDQEAFQREVTALQAHLDAVRGLEQAHERLAAEERELLHHLEGIRLSRLHAALGDPEAGRGSAAAQLQEAQDHLRAAAEVEERLAAARQAHAAARRHQV